MYEKLEEINRTGVKRLMVKDPDLVGSLSKMKIYSDIVFSDLPKKRIIK